MSSGFQYPPMGFDASNVVLHYFNSKTSGSGGSDPTIGSGGRNSTNGLIITVPTGATNPFSRAIKTLPVNLATGYQPFAMTYNALPTTGEIIFCELRDSGATQLDLRLLTDGRIRITRAGNVDDGVPTGAADTRQAVDETPPDDDTTRSALQNVGDKVLLTYAPIPLSEQVLCVALVERAALSAPGTGKYKSLVKIGGTEYLGSVEKAPSAGSYAYLGEVQMVSPATGVEYTASEVNGAQFGAEKTA